MARCSRYGPVAGPESLAAVARCTVSGRAAAAAGSIALIAAGAGVHRGNQLKKRRKAQAAREPWRM